MKKATIKTFKDFEGELVIKLPSARQRIRYIKECNFSFEDSKLNVSNNLEAMEKMYVIANSHIEKVDLKHKEGTVFKDWESMTEDSDCDDLCEKIIGCILQGSLGEG